MTILSGLEHRPADSSVTTARPGRCAILMKRMGFLQKRSTRLRQPRTVRSGQVVSRESIAEFAAEADGYFTKRIPTRAMKLNTSTRFFSTVAEDYGPLAARASQSGSPVSGQKSRLPVHLLAGSEAASPKRRMAPSGLPANACRTWTGSHLMAAGGVSNGYRSLVSPTRR